MSDTEASSIARFLPAIFQETAADPEGPLAAVLSTFEGLQSGVAKHIEPRQSARHYDPHIVRWEAESGDSVRDEEWLDWLSTWVCLTFEEDGPGSSPGPRDEASHRKRQLIKTAVSLHRQRGTVSGLSRALTAFYDVTPKIVERSWPRGMEIGTHSEIGVDTLIQNAPEPSRAFVVVLDVSEVPDFSASTREFADLSDAGRGAPTSGWIDIPLAGACDDEIVSSLVITEDPPREGPPRQGEFGTKVERMIDFIQREKPAHTACYVGFKRAAREAERPVPAFEIGIESTIGMFVIVNAEA